MSRPSKRTIASRASAVASGKKRQRTTAARKEIPQKEALFRVVVQVVERLRSIRNRRMISLYSIEMDDGLYQRVD
jgi:hypothetical protein